jgi:hypothetical protein
MPYLPLNRPMTEREPQPLLNTKGAEEGAAPIFLDFEASSLDLICSYPIEVGICLGDGSLHSWLIRPAPLWNNWSEQAQAIHGIPRERLMDEGLQVQDVASLLNERLVGNVYSDAWTFDSFWLHRLYKAAHTKPSFWLESVSLLLSPAQIHAWKNTRRQIIDQLGLTTHRAANDARILHETWQALKSL